VRLWGWGTQNCLLKCILQIVSKNFGLHKNSFLTVLCCSSASNVCLVIAASYLWVVSECDCFAVSWELLWYQVGSRSELLDGIVWYGFLFVSFVVL